MYHQYNKEDTFMIAMQSYMKSNRYTMINFNEIIKIYSIIHNVDFDTTEDIVSQLIYELNNIVFSDTPIKMHDLVLFTANWLRLNKNICFCFLAWFYYENVLNNTEITLDTVDGVSYESVM